MDKDFWSLLGRYFHKTARESQKRTHIKTLKIQLYCHLIHVSKQAKIKNYNSILLISTNLITIRIGSWLMRICVVIGYKIEKTE